MEINDKSPLSQVFGDCDMLLPASEVIPVSQVHGLCTLKPNFLFVHSEHSIFTHVHTQIVQSEEVLALIPEESGRNITGPLKYSAEKNVNPVERQQSTRATEMV